MTPYESYNPHTQSDPTDPSETVTQRQPERSGLAYPRASGMLTSANSTPNMEPGFQSAPAIGPNERRRSPRMKLAIGCLVALGALMALCAITTGIGSALVFASQPATSTTTRTFHVSGAPTIQLDVSAAGVNVNSGATDGQVSVTLTARIQTFSHQAAENAIQSIKFTTTQTGNTIAIGESEGENTFAHLGAFFSRLTLDITVPTHTNLSGEVQAGSMTVEGLTGSVNVTNDAGSMTLQQMTFTGSSILQLSAGSLTFDGSLAQGAQVNATVNAGSATCTLPKSSGAHLDANTSAGSISVDGWNLPVAQDTANESAHGDVGAHPVGSLTIQADAGSVTVILV